MQFAQGRKSHGRIFARIFAITLKQAPRNGADQRVGRPQGERLDFLIGGGDRHSVSHIQGDKRGTDHGQHFLQPVLSIQAQRTGDFQFN